QSSGFTGCRDLVLLPVLLFCLLRNRALLRSGLSLFGAVVLRLLPVFKEARVKLARSGNLEILLFSKGKTSRASARGQAESKTLGEKPTLGVNSGLGSSPRALWFPPQSLLGMAA